MDFDGTPYQNLHARWLDKDKSRVEMRLLQVLHAVHFHIENANLSRGLHFDDCFFTESQREQR